MDLTRRLTYCHNLPCLSTTPEIHSVTQTLTKNRRLLESFGFSSGTDMHLMMWPSPRVQRTFSWRDKVDVQKDNAKRKRKTTIDSTDGLSARSQHTQAHKSHNTARQSTSSGKHTVIILTRSAAKEGEKGKIQDIPQRE